MVFYIVVALLVIFLLPKGIAFFMPFILGWFISVIANPAVKFFEEKIRFKRKASSAIMIILILALVILIGYGIVVFLVNQVMGFVNSAPEKWGSIQNGLDNFGKSFNNLTRSLPEALKEPLNNFGQSIKDWLASFVSGMGGGNGVVNGITNGLGSVANILIGVIMFVLSAYFFAVEHNTLVERMEKILPQKAYSKFMAAYRGLKNAVGGYIRAQVIIEFWVYLITMIGLLILRVDYAVIIALGIAFLDFLPFFGAGLIMVPWAVISIINEKYFLGIGMLVVWGIGQTVRQLIQPKIVGDKVGMAPLPTLILLYIGYKIMGVFGMVLALPVAMIFVSLYEEGLFSTFVESVKILWKGMSNFRKLPADESQSIEGEKK